VKRRAFLAAAAACAAAPAFAAPERYARGLLWRVGKAGIAPSHVFGTLHAADRRLAALPAPARRAFEGSRALMLENVADDYGRERFLEAAMYLDRRTLEEEIGRADFERAWESLKPAGLSREFVNKLKPWGVLLNLRSSWQPGAGATPDAQLYALARRRRMPVSQIEDTEELVFTFDELPMASQVALLRHSLARRDELAALAERTLQAYLARDLAAIWRAQEEFTRRHPEIAAHQAALYKRVVLDRSVVMAFRMQRELRRGRAFVALGALHLYGERGVLALLGEDGYAAERVY
jgi:uncharacterized protein YbaP (TraB family)